MIFFFYYIEGYIGICLKNAYIMLPRVENVEKKNKLLDKRMLFSTYI